MDTFSGEATIKTVFASSLTSIYSKREEFATNVSKFCPFRVDCFSEGERCVGKQKNEFQNLPPMLKIMGKKRRKQKVY